MVNSQILFSMVDNQERHQQGSPGVRGTGTLWINLKINDNSSRICNVCNKGFSSGKALGGHMRIHVPAANKEFISGKKRKKLNQPIACLYKKPKLEKQEEEKETPEVDILKKKSIDNEPSVTCSVCGKNFPSIKSLFGHMRCHPDRDWRGIQPPPNNNMSDHKKDSATASVNLSKTVGGWSVTAKRGRGCKPIIDYSRNCSSEEEQQVHDAVHYLMLLAYGDSLQSRRGSAHKTTGIKKRTVVDETQLRIEGTNICLLKTITKRRGRKMMKLKDLRSVQHHASNSTVFSTPEKCNSVEEAA